MKSADIRQSFVDFFVDNGHRSWPSGPLVPHGDPTLLFTNAGMVPFKDYFLGAERPENRRAVSVQKCMRVSGKHNDLENVGPSPRHHTFFEMLGNFSFGDYFKEEAIRLAWSLVTEVWGFSPEVLTVTVYEEDDEAADLWRKISGLPPGRILRCGKEDNFWSMGETGPCGPCSEIFVDVHPERSEEPWEQGTSSGRYLEIWNLVFMQFERGADGSMTPLPDPSIDTGAGLERVAAVLQKVESNYDSDLFQPILRAAAALAGTEYGRDEEADISFRVLADHVRAATFLLADGVIPGSEGRGYVVRRIVRRAVRHGMSLGFEEPFLHRLVPVVGEVLGRCYAELRKTATASVATVEAEERKFLDTVAMASKVVQEAIDRQRRGGSSLLPGSTVFRLYDTFGLPVELIREIAEEERMDLDETGFREALEEQRSRSRAAISEGRGWLDQARLALGNLGELPPTEFLGYDRLEVEGARIQALVRLADDGAEVVQRLGSGEEGVVVLDRTPFYAEAGGQVGDRGRLSGSGAEALIGDTQKTTAGAVLHRASMETGGLETKDEVTARVDSERRLATQRNHTATHLLHAALRRELGEGVRQAGSLVAPDRLRFDFTFPGAVPEEKLRRIEDGVNRWTLASEEVEIQAGRDFSEAVAAGAMALFGEKYDDQVRTVEVAGGPGSLELCGGCHVGSTGEIGPFLILSERGVASGVRRIEAITGEAALAEGRRWGEQLAELAAEAGVPAERLRPELRELKRRTRELERELAALRTRLVSGSLEDEGRETTVDGVKVLTREVPPAPVAEVRNLADVLRSKLGSGVVVLATRDEGKVTLVAAVTEDLAGRVHAGDLAREIARRVGGSGGGRADFAQAGGRDAAKLPGALEAVEGLVRERLASSAG